MRRLIGHKLGFVGRHSGERLAARPTSDAIHMEAAGFAAALHQRQHDVLMTETGLGLANALLTADESFVAFNHAAGAAHRRKAASAHGFANAVAHKPSRLVANAERSVELVGADTFLAGVHQVECHDPLVQRDMAALHDRADGDGEVLAAFTFSAQAGPACFLDRVGVIDYAAIRANWALPTNGCPRLTYGRRCHP